MESYKVELTVKIKFLNKEKEVFDNKLIKDIIEYLEFNDYEVEGKIRLKDSGFENSSGSLIEYKEYLLILTSSILNMDVNASKQVSEVAANFPDTKNHVISASQALLKVPKLGP